MRQDDPSFRRGPDDELLPKERVLGDQLGTRASQIGDEALATPSGEGVVRAPRLLDAPKIR
jgi:hypothetical protein